MARRQTQQRSVEGGRREFRIIGGEFRRRRLVYAADPGLRPMKERTREALFNTLGDAVRASHAVDLFAGTGAVGLEALSRGAAHLTAVEHSPVNADQLRRNATVIGAEKRVTVLRADALRWTPERLPRELPWSIFCCPPYSLLHTATDAMLGLIEHILRAAPEDSCMVLEADQQWPVEHLPESPQWVARHYAPATLYLWRS